MSILGGSRTICYVIRRSSAITTAAALKDNYFEVPGFDFRKSYCFSCEQYGTIDI